MTNVSGSEWISAEMCPSGRSLQHGYGSFHTVYHAPSTESALPWGMCLLPWELAMGKLLECGCLVTRVPSFVGGQLPRQWLHFLKFLSSVISSNHSYPNCSFGSWLPNSLVHARPYFYSVTNIPLSTADWEGLVQGGSPILKQTCVQTQPHILTSSDPG